MVDKSPNQSDEEIIQYIMYVMGIQYNVYFSAQEIFSYVVLYIWLNL